MKAKKTYAVFGLGRYGAAVARELVENGMEVIAVDSEQKIVNDAAAYLPICKCADVSDAEVISRLGIGSVDTVIVCMASNLGASVMAVTLCKQAGVKTVIAKCANEMQQKILLRVGADQVVFPENESGIRLAKNLLSSGFIDMISLSKDVSIVEIDVKKEWLGKNLVELNLRKKHGINVVAIKKGEIVSVDINPEQKLDQETTLIIIANTAKLEKLK
ncbi:MAG: TrkA family potassium uptake protein [Clostridiales bacterium]|nr:TrkA family potassium uptake protein [Clostridiales bacterium]MBQ3020439.1 TrkA family potassium uptake protein [Clostridia bacterium]